MFEIGIIIFIAFLLDLMIGDPSYKYHPIRLIGNFVQGSENLLRNRGLDGKGGGILLALSTAGFSLLIYFVLEGLMTRIHPYLSLLFNLFMVYSCLAIGDLLRHVAPVEQALEGGNCVKARQSLSMTVGRDVRALNEAGIARAAIETLSENFVDGFLSPVFWYFFGSLFFLLLGADPVSGGIGAMLLFKAVSTLDSMVGYKNERYLLFGWCGARMDDLMNFLPARLSIAFLFFGALITGLKGVQGLHTALRDRLKHESPNSAHPESFAAGALSIRLGGPTLYADGMKKKPWLGEGDQDATPVHIRKAIALIRTSAWLVILPSFVMTILHVVN